jgi:glutamyl-tRNA synthetase
VPFDDETEKLAKTLALKNALEHGGKAALDAVISKFIGSRPDKRSEIKLLIPEIRTVVQSINAMPALDQKALLAQLAPGELETKKQTVGSTSSLPPLQEAVVGSVVTRFPPEPNGYPHIGHAKAAIIDEEYARIYKGKLILRFDDTNPLKEKLEYYDAILEGLKWLGVKPDIIKNTSDDILKIHELGTRLVEIGGAYVCTCTQDKIRDMRAKGIECECRLDHSVALDRIRKMFDGSYEQNQAIIRFKGDMKDENTAMRDPALFRIIEGQHPLLGKKIRVWPTYDFAAPIEDSLDGVTHAMRTKEYELRNALYFAILDRLGMRKPIMIEFSRLEFEGLPVSKRKIRPLIDDGVISAWDDPRLPTLSGFRRRGFVPEAIRKFVLSLGITLAETKPPFESLEAYNRKIIDPKCIRLFFVRDPVEVCILGAEPLEVTLKNHPTDASLGQRRVKVLDRVYISAEDAALLKKGDEVRLIELYNVRIKEIELNNNGKGPLIIAQIGSNEIRQSMPKIQWIAKNDIVDFKVMIPKQLYIGEEYNTNSLEIANGGAESFAAALTPDTHVQFVRFGFCRIDGKNTAIFTHR